MSENSRASGLSRKTSKSHDWLGNLANGKPLFALETLHKMAIDNHRDAQFKLGRAYRAGLCIDRNLEFAVCWFIEAAEAGHVGAMLELVMLALQGVPVLAEENGKCNNSGPSAAFYWGSKAVLTGNDDALRLLTQITLMYPAAELIPYCKISRKYVLSEFDTAGVPTLVLTKEYRARL